MSKNLKKKKVKERRKKEKFVGIPASYGFRDSYKFKKFKDEVIHYVFEKLCLGKGVRHKYTCILFHIYQRNQRYFRKCTPFFDLTF
jgi:hypothetical protein